MHTLPRLADETEAELARADQEMHDQFGPDERTWDSGQRRDYFLALDAARIAAGWVVA
ncbi:hypothetical protein GCM10010317_077890 [Streptomyces mirabilis]|uniref:hypothetical protein n=1 Tax=Streptomyces mirabilis TaxID=68239 RepID=UPI00167E9EFD|nr:hypothetical protein [Streptomyces mirabilis]GHD70495.1 hypothetical protein GCM10010317_077890 [Streptomyces mirabilis]